MGAFYFGAGNGSRTRVSAMARQYNSHYTIPAKCIDSRLIFNQLFELNAALPTLNFFFTFQSLLSTFIASLSIDNFPWNSRLC